jgi:hypothetical protein
MNEDDLSTYYIWNMSEDPADVLIPLTDGMTACTENTYEGCKLACQ